MVAVYATTIYLGSPLRAMMMLRNSLPGSKGTGEGKDKKGQHACSVIMTKSLGDLVPHLFFNGKVSSLYASRSGIAEITAAISTFWVRASSKLLNVSRESRSSLEVRWRAKM